MNEVNYDEEVRSLTDEISEIKAGIARLGVEAKKKHIEFKKVHDLHGEELVNLAIGRCTNAGVNKIFRQRELIGKWLDDYDKTCRYADARSQRLNSMAVSFEAKNIRDCASKKHEKEVEMIEKLLAKGLTPAEVVIKSGFSRERVSEIMFNQ